MGMAMPAAMPVVVASRGGHHWHREVDEMVEWLAHDLSGDGDGGEGAVAATDEVRRDVQRLLGGAYEEFLAKKL